MQMGSCRKMQMGSSHPLPVLCATPPRHTSLFCPPPPPPPTHTHPTHPHPTTTTTTSHTRTPPPPTHRFRVLCLVQVALQHQLDHALLLQPRRERLHVGDATGRPDEKDQG